MYNFENLSTEDKFIWLLSCEDNEIISLTSKLLIDLFKERKQRITLKKKIEKKIII